MHGASVYGAGFTGFEGLLTTGTLQDREGDPKCPRFPCAGDVKRWVAGLSRLWATPIL
jgi:hypothetical protein